MNRKAQGIIDKELRDKTGILDFYECPLHELPEQIFEMTWLTALNMSANYSWNTTNEVFAWERSSSIKYKRNIAIQIKSLSNLKHLCFADHNLTKIEGLSFLYKLKYLNLKNNEISKIEDLDNLTELTTLYLSGNEISKIEGLDNLKNLKYLYLSSCKLKKIDGLDKLTNVSTLYLSGNKILKIEGLHSLKSLKSLYLNNNNISKIEGLNNLKNLRSLYLYDNSLSKIEGLNNLPCLSYLYLSGNKISKIEGLDSLKGLNKLYLSENDLLKIEGLDDLLSLKSLNISSNSIPKIENLEKLSSLKSLYLSNNQISKLDPTVHLPNGLEYIDLRNNPIIDITPEELAVSGNHLSELRKIYENSKHITKEEATDLPVKIIVLGNSETGKTTFCKEIISDSSQFDASDDESTHGLKIRNWEYDGGLKALFYDFGGQDYYHASYQMFFSTKAIYIQLWDAQRSGNQKIEISKKGKSFSKNEQYISYNPSYWYENIRYYQGRQDSKLDGDNIKIITLQNLFGEDNPQTLHIDTSPNSPDVDYQFHIGLFPKPEGLHQMRLDLLSETLKEEITTFNRKIKLNDQDKQVIEGIKAQVGDPKTTYKCRSVVDFINSITEETDRILKVLHKMGMVLYFHDHEQLKDYYWIDPSTVSNQIYSVLNRFENKNTSSGRVGKKELNKACNKEVPTSEKQENQLRILMETQEIIFKDDYDGNYIIPQYLPEGCEEDPLYEIATQGMINGFTLKFSKFVPHGMMSRLICRYGRNPYKKHFYRYEIVFNLGTSNSRSNSTKAAKVRIKLDPIDLFMKIWVALPTGFGVKREDVFSYLFQAILAAYWNTPHKTFAEWNEEERTYKKDLFEKHKIKDDSSEEIEWLKREPSVWDKMEVEKYVPHDVFLSVDNSLFAAYNKLRTQDKEGKEIEPQRMVEAQSLDTDDDKQVLIKRAPFNPFVRKEAHQVKSVFISYSHDDLEYRRELQKYLINLERDHIIEVWQDGQITPGMDWDKTIKSQMEKADLVIMLISQNFIASNYIHHVEMKKAFEQMQSGKTKILPILLSECDWEEWNVYGVKIEDEVRDHGRVGNYQFAPIYKDKNDPNADSRLRPINKWTHPEDAWKQIANYLRKGRLE